MFSDSQFTGEDISALDIKMPGRAVLFMDSGEYPLQLLFWFGVFLPAVVWKSFVSQRCCQVGRDILCKVHVFLSDVNFHTEEKR